MIALEIRFLTGRYAATRFNNRFQAEWPPHPARVYSALTAALYDDPDHGPEERQALEWLAAAGPPSVLASPAHPRFQREVYVPTNDGSALPTLEKQLLAVIDAQVELQAANEEGRKTAEKALSKAEAALRKASDKSVQPGGGGNPKIAAWLLPEGRRRKPQPRTFPVVIPVDDTVHMEWSQEPPEAVVSALDRVAGRVARLGHSSSFVSMRVVRGGAYQGDRTRWVPHERGGEVLRVATEGQLERLTEAHEQHQQVAPRVLPAGFVSYIDKEDTPSKRPRPCSHFESQDWIIFQVVPAPGSKRRRLLDVSLAQKVTRAFRGTLQRAIDGQWPEVLSGHAADGGPSQRPHLAYAVLANVGHEYSSGSILGVALIPPRGLTEDERRELLRAVGLAEEAARRPEDDELEPATLKLVLGRSGELHIGRLRDVSPTQTLQAQRWTRPTKRWVTATAIALGRNPGNLASRDPGVVERAVEEAEATVRQDCVNIGLPEPDAVWIHRRSLLQGVPEARRFMPYPSSGQGPRRVCVHAEVLFPEAVEGPVLLGAGRHFGIGLCAPVVGS